MILYYFIACDYKGHCNGVAIREYTIYFHNQETKQIIDVFSSFDEDEVWREYDTFIEK